MPTNDTIGGVENKKGIHSEDGGFGKEEEQEDEEEE